MLIRVDDERKLALYSTLSIGLLIAAVSIVSPSLAFGQDGTSATPRPEIESINIFTLLVQGGAFMIPILLMSLLVVTFTIERFIGLRRDRVLPEALVTGLGQLGGPQGGFDPRKAYRLCQQYPSAAARVVKAMLLKVGRPVSEIEHTVAETSQRESERLYFNVRWLNLAASIGPLIGLIGTIQGMILAFHGLSTLEAGQKSLPVLADGIYTALATTFAGLFVAIPAAMASQYFEGRLILYFH